MLILVTGATGKVGRRFIEAIKQDPRCQRMRVYDVARLIDAAWDYQRAPDDPRKIWYPG
jgi:uncharacterized protein YbjT (DUF2867 family)